MTIPRGLTKYERRNCGTSTRVALLFVRTSSDNAVLNAARDSNSDDHSAMYNALGTDTNPYWITAQCAEEAYERGLLSVEEFDYITR